MNSVLVKLNKNQQKSIVGGAGPSPPDPPYEPPALNGGAQKYQGA
jgi:hypothetical protein